MYQCTIIYIIYVHHVHVNTNIILLLRAREATGKRQRITEAKVVKLLKLLYIRKRLVSGAVVARRGETQRTVLDVLTSVMAKTREARRGETPSGEGEKSE